VVMSLKIKARGKKFRIAGTLAGKEVRLSSGTGNAGAAATLVNRIERAFAEGPTSPLWKN
jgi:hypothetical protein